MSAFSIRARLIILFAVLLCLFFASFLYVTRELSTQSIRIAEESQLVSVVKTANSANRYYGDLKYWLSDLATSLLMRSEREVNRARTSLDTELSLLRPHANEDVAAIRRDIELMMEFALKAVDAHTQNERVLGNSLMAKAQVYIERIDGHFDTIVRRVEADAQSRANESSEQVSRTLKLVSSIFLACAVIGLIATILILRSITGPLEELDIAMTAMTDGKFDVAIPSTGGDEIGKMAKTLELFRQSSLERENLTKARVEAEARAIESEARLRGAVDSIRDAMAYFDADDRLVFWNDEYVRTLAGSAHLIRQGTKFEEIIRNNVETGWIPSDRETKEDVIQNRLLRHREQQGMYVRETAQGNWYIVQDAKTPDGGTVVTLTDISALKETEESLLRAKEIAEHASRAKTEFLANMSHELRTPLNSIIGFSGAMSNEIYGPQGHPQYAEYSKHILWSGEHLLAVIGDILDISKIEAGEAFTDEAPVDVTAVIESCETMVKGQAREKGIKLRMDVPAALPQLRADARQLKQIILNLLSNSLKFTETGGRVTLSVRLHPGQEMSFQVEDTGIGIAAEDIAKVLEPFGRVHSNPEVSSPGTGLGLSLSKQLAELHGGSLGIESTLGEGTKVTVIMPAGRTISSVSSG